MRKSNESSDTERTNMHGYCGAQTEEHQHDRRIQNRAGIPWKCWCLFLSIGSDVYEFAIYNWMWTQSHMIVTHKQMHRECCFVKLSVYFCIDNSHGPPGRIFSIWLYSGYTYTLLDKILVWKSTIFRYILDDGNEKPSRTQRWLKANWMLLTRCMVW